MCQVQTPIELDSRNHLCFLHNFIYFEITLIFVSIISTFSWKRSFDHLVIFIYFDNFFNTSKRLFMALFHFHSRPKTVFPIKIYVNIFPFIAIKAPLLIFIISLFEKKKIIHSPKFPKLPKRIISSSTYQHVWHYSMSLQHHQVLSLLLHQ